MNKFLDYTLFEIGEYSLKLSALILLAIFIAIVIVIVQVIKKLIFKSRKIDIAKKYSVFSLIKYFILVFTCVMALQILGFNLSVLLAGSAALLVGIGLGLQNLFSDFISGIILLADSSIKVSDVIEVNNIVCKVQEINIRTTTVLTRDDKYIILPNTDLTKNKIINWTHSKISSRFEVLVGVDYSSDVKLVMRLLQQAAVEQTGVLKLPSPFVRFNDFADSSLNFSVHFWADDVFRAENLKSDIRVRIHQLFKENNVTIPFPQRVVHMQKS